jgi:hypothetical protein
VSCTCKVWHSLWGASLCSSYVCRVGILKEGRCLYDVGGVSLAFATGSDLLFWHITMHSDRGVHPVMLDKKRLHTPLLVFDMIVTYLWAAVCHAAHTSLQLIGVRHNVTVLKTSTVLEHNMLAGVSCSSGTAAAVPSCCHNSLCLLCGYWQP